MVKQHQHAHRDIYILQIVVDQSGRISRTGAMLFRGFAARFQSLTPAFPQLHTTQHDTQNCNDCHSSNYKVADLKRA